MPRQLPCHAAPWRGFAAPAQVALRLLLANEALATRIRERQASGALPAMRYARVEVLEHLCDAFEEHT